MTWSHTLRGSYHEVVKGLKAYQAPSDNLAEQFGHVQIAKDAVLAIIDHSKAQDVVFNVSIGGHTSTKGTFQLSTGVSVTQNIPEGAKDSPAAAPPESNDTSLGTPPGPTK